MLFLVIKAAEAFLFLPPLNYFSVVGIEFALTSWLLANLKIIFISVSASISVFV